jgi:hypothetical protein
MRYEPEVMEDGTDAGKRGMNGIVYETYSFGKKKIANNEHQRRRILKMRV